MNACNGLCVILRIKFSYLLLSPCIMFDCTWRFVYEAAYVLIETLQFPIRSSHHIVQQNKFFIYLFCYAQYILLWARSSTTKFFFLFEFVFVFCSLYACGLGVLQWNLIGKNEQFRLLLRSFITSYFKDNSASRTCCLWVLLEPLVHLLSCRHHLSIPYGQHKVLPVSEQIYFLSCGS